MSSVPASFVVPSRKILSPDDVSKWEASAAFKDLIDILMALNASVKGKKLTDKLEISENTLKLLTMLQKLSDVVDQVPPIDQPQRFGNKAFKTWYERIQNSADELLRESLPEGAHPAIVEVKVYLTESFGNSTRIDYGTGHELCFLMFLCCLFKLEVLKEADAPAAVLKVFAAYLELCRKLQTLYRMEPAGSHGVWSLDDYQFVPFIWGSGQLVDHPRLKPNHFVDADYYESFAKDFMFLGCIKYIAKVKTGPFPEHSNQLWNISGVAAWAKVNQGLVKMYKAEVLAKFPVVQHCLFGNLISIQAAKGQ